MTAYVVLKNEGPNRWVSVATLEAHSASDAIRRHGQEGTYVALPARSWRPLIVSSETITRTKLEAATGAPAPAQAPLAAAHEEAA